MHIMLDSGATISFISQHTKMSIPSLAKRPINKKYIMSQAVTGQGLDTLGMVDITFRLGSQNLQHEVQVIRNVTQGFILGLGIPLSYSGYLEPRQLEMDGISVAHTLSTAVNGCTVIRIINPTPRPMMLYSGMQL